MRVGAWGLAHAEANDAMHVTACKASCGGACAEAEGPDLGMLMHECALVTCMQLGP